MTTIPSTAKTGGRLLFVDHLRVALTILVVLDHVAFFSLADPGSSTNPLARVLFLAFILINEGYFMGLFFLVSGYLTPAAFDRKGPASFLKDRLLRLGIPLVVGMFVVVPIATWVTRYAMRAGLTAGSLITPFTWQDYPKLVSPGHLWFLELLLVFDFGYAVWRLATRGRKPRPISDPSFPSYRQIGVFVLALALVTCLFRIVVPYGTTAVGLASPYELPQYLSFFVLGTVAYRRNWLRTLPGAKGKVGLVVAPLVTLVLFPLALSGGAGYTGLGDWHSAAYTLWEAALAVGMGLGLVALFRRLFDRPGWLGRFTARSAYAVYIIHLPIVALLVLALRGLPLGALPKSGLVAILAVPLCFATAYLVRKLPLASRVL